jgi:hypothetical protein
VSPVSAVTSSLVANKTVQSIVRIARHKQLIDIHKRVGELLDDKNYRVFVDGKLYLSADEVSKMLRSVGANVSEELTL